MIMPLTFVLLFGLAFQLPFSFIKYKLQVTSTGNARLLTPIVHIVNLLDYKTRDINNTNILHI